MNLLRLHPSTIQDPSKMTWLVRVLIATLLSKELRERDDHLG